MTGVSLEIFGRAAVEKRPTGSSAGSSSSLEIIGKAAVEKIDVGSSLEIIGKAAVQNDTGGGSLAMQIIGKAGGPDSEGEVRTHMVHFTWTNGCLAGAAISVWCVVLLVRFIYIWQECLLTNGQNSWSVVRASLLLGTEIALLVMSVLLFFLVPRMIVAWTTTVVFEYMLGVLVYGNVGNTQMVKDGTKIAKEISWITLTGVFEEGNLIAAAVLIVCVTTTAVLRQILTV